MNRLIKTLIPGIVALAFAAHSSPALACAMCAGKADGPLADGMNWGIFSLLGMVVCVLGTIGAFFIYLARKAAQAESAETKPEMVATPGKA
jgi:heme/copper-type cytochrome/quinol oxidase subunit 2